MSDITRDLDEEARAGNEKVELSDEGMPLESEDVPEGAREDGHEGSAVDPD